MSNEYKKQLPLNLISNLGYFGMNVLIGICMVPYLIKHLGVEGYGFIPLAASVTAYANLITLALNGAVARYLVIALQKNDNEGANLIFNTSFWSLTLVSIVLVPIFGVFSWLTPRIFKVPLHLTAQVQGFFFEVLFSFIVSVFLATFSVSTFVNNRLELRNIIDTVNVLVRNILIVLLFFIYAGNLISVGFAYLIGVLTSLLLGYFFFRRLTPSLKISYKYFDSSRLRELISMGGWLVVNQIGALLFLQIDLIVANILFGAHEAGKYGAIIQWSFLLRTFAGVIAGVLTPMVFISHAKNESEKIVSMAKCAVKFMGLGMAVPVGLLCGFAKPLLTIWLGSDYVSFAPLLCLLTFHLVVNLAVLPLFAINNAYNQLRIPGLVTLVMGIVNLLLAIILGKCIGWGLYGIAIAGAIVLTLKNTFFTPLYAAYVLEIPYDTFIKPVCEGVFLAGISMAIGWTLSRIVLIDGWSKLLLTGGIAFMLLSVLGVALLGKDRVYFYSVLGIRRHIISKG